MSRPRVTRPMHLFLLHNIYNFYIYIYIYVCICTLGKADPGIGILYEGIIVYYRNAYVPFTKADPGIGILYLCIIVYYRNAYFPLQKLTQELVYYIWVLYYTTEMHMYIGKS